MIYYENEVYFSKNIPFWFYKIFFSHFIGYGQGFFEAKTMTVNITLPKLLTTFGKGQINLAKQVYQEKFPA